MQTFRRLSQTLIFLLGFGSLFPLTALAEEVQDCIDDLCSVSFEFSGEPVSYSFPLDARNISFEVYGAQGGKDGGGGGAVFGELSFVPESLWLVVGGAPGWSSEGGYNGGGVAGGSNVVSGGGGGASDIRLSGELESRIVVAGGGGGKGGSSSLSGGAGGGLIAQNGQLGANAGGGATQLAGGTGGAGSSRHQGRGIGQSGSLGIGGAGGSNNSNGGGGGGGGYFGGGGGGAEGDHCCNGSGAGGGSSFADSELTLAVSHQQGVRFGSGLIVLRYQLVPTVKSISSIKEFWNSSPEFAIDFSSQVFGLSLEHFLLVQESASCELAELTGEAASYLLSLRNCLDGEVAIQLMANSVNNHQLPGPELAIFSTTLTIDQTPPRIVSFNHLAELEQIEFELTEPVTAITLESVVWQSESTDCQLVEISALTELHYLLLLSQCEQAQFSLLILGAQLSDRAGNIASDFLFEQIFLTASVQIDSPQPKQPAQEPESQLPTPANDSLADMAVDLEQPASPGPLAGASASLPAGAPAASYPDRVIGEVRIPNQAAQSIIVPLEAFDKPAVADWPIALILLGLAGFIAGAIGIRNVAPEILTS